MKTNNVRYFFLDWKEKVSESKLKIAIKEVLKFGNGIKIITNGIETNNDSYAVLIVPEYFNFDILTEEVGNIFYFASAVHVDKDNKLWFKFDAQCGLPATDWLNTVDSQTWVEKIETIDNTL